MKRKGSKGKSTWIAVGLFVALGAWVWFAERGELREPGQAPPVSEVIGMKPEDVTRVELLHDGQTLALAKASSPASPGAGGGWRVEQPVQAQADDAQVKQVIEGLLKSNADQVVGEKVTDLKQYGLDKPAFQVTLADDKGHRKVIQTGLKDVRGFSVYARATDSPKLFLLSSYSVEDLQKKKPDDLRDKTALAVDPNTVTQLALQTPAQTVRVQKQGAKWGITTPKSAPADGDEVKQVLDQIKDLRVDKFGGGAAEGAAPAGGGPDLARYGLARPQLTVTVTTPAGEKGLLLGKTSADGKEVYAMRQGERQVFQLPKNALTDLSKKPDDLRDKTLLSFKRDDATRVTITTPAQTLELDRAGKEWKITKPMPAKPKEDRLSTLLFTLEVVKGSRLVEEKPANLARYGLDKPEVRVEVTLPKGQDHPFGAVPPARVPPVGRAVVIELLIGKKASATDYYARSSSQDAVFTVPDFTVTDLKIKPLDLAQSKR